MKTKKIIKKNVLEKQSFSGRQKSKAFSSELETLSEKDAKKFIQILETADGGCSFCVSDLLKHFTKAFPQHKGLAKKSKEKIRKSLRENKQGSWGC